MPLNLLGGVLLRCLWICYWDVFDFAGRKQILCPQECFPRRANVFTCGKYWWETWCFSNTVPQFTEGVTYCAQKRRVLRTPALRRIFDNFRQQFSICFKTRKNLHKYCHTFEFPLISTASLFLYICIPLVFGNCVACRRSPIALNNQILRNVGQSMHWNAQTSDYIQRHYLL